MQAKPKASPCEPVDEERWRVGEKERKREGEGAAFLANSASYRADVIGST